MNTSQLIILNFFTTFIISCILCLIFTTPYKEKSSFAQLNDSEIPNITAEDE